MPIPSQERSQPTAKAYRPMRIRSSRFAELTKLPRSRRFAMNVVASHVLSLTATACGSLALSYENNSNATPPVQAAAAAIAPASDSHPETLQSDIEGWIADLDHPSYNRREWATSQLFKNLELGYPTIAAALPSSSGEARIRLAGLFLDVFDDPKSSHHMEATLLLKNLADRKTGSSGLVFSRLYDRMKRKLASKTWSRIHSLSPKIRNEFPSGSRLLVQQNPLYISDEFLGTVEDLKGLELVTGIEFACLEGAKIDSHYLEAVLKLPDLKHLQLVRANLTADDLRLLEAGPTLKMLELIYVPVEDDLVDRLPNLPITDTLWIYGTKLTKDGAKRAEAAVTDLELFVSRGAFLGLQCPESSLHIDKIVPYSAAEKAGLQVRDRVTKVNDVHLENFSDLLRELAQFAPGESAVIEFQRDVLVEPDPDAPMGRGEFPAPESLRMKRQTMKTEVTFGTRSTE